jgi:hypothetical protein
MRRDLKYKATAMEVLHFEGIKNGRKVVGVELDVDDGTDDGFYRAKGTFGFSCICAG